MRRFAKFIKKLPIWAVCVGLFLLSALLLLVAQPTADAFIEFSKIKDSATILSFQYWFLFALLSCLGFLVWVISVLVRLFDNRFMQHLDE